MEGNEDHPGLVAGEIRRDETTRRTCPGRIRCSGWCGVPLVRARPSERRDTECERLHHLTDRSQVQDCAQAGGQREMERAASDPAQAHDYVSANRARRPREAERKRGWRFLNAAKASRARPQQRAQTAAGYEARDRAAPRSPCFGGSSCTAPRGSSGADVRHRERLLIMRAGPIVHFPGRGECGASTSGTCVAPTVSCRRGRSDRRQRSIAPRRRRTSR